MKLKYTTLLLVGFIAASGLRAHETLTIPHAHPKFKTIATTYELDDGAVVMWQAEEDASRPDSDKTSYTVTIVQAAAKPVTYSLLTLGVQAIKHDNIILSAKPETGDVTIVAPGDSETSKRSFPVFVPRTGIKADPDAPKQEKLDADRIWFVRFSSKVCVLQLISANRTVYGVTQWAKSTGSPGEGHDNTPPENPPQ
jgi:hypothetical protein